VNPQRRVALSLFAVHSGSEAAPKSLRLFPLGRADISTIAVGRFE
jgi:hypothetical protein